MVGRPVLDSDVLIDYLRGAGPGHELVRKLVRASGYRVTAVSAFELALGRSYRRDPRTVHAVLASPVLTLTRAAGLRGGSLLQGLSLKGEAIDVRDAMQAGICLEADVQLVTRNTSHFKRIGELNLAHPVELL